MTPSTDVPATATTETYGRAVESPEPVSVVIDTNVWRSELLLRTSMGVAVLHAVHRTGSRICLPEVVERELRKHIVAAGVEAVGSTRRGLETIQRLTGSMPVVPLPSEDELGQKVDERLAELSSLIDRVPFDIDHARRALDRVDDQLPPNGPKNQQFKDSVIWEVVLDVAATRPVLLITSDKAFYDSRDPKRGLAPSLKREAEERSVVVDAFPDLTGAAERLRESVPPLDDLLLAEIIAGAIEPDVRRQAESHGFDLVGPRDRALTAFVTEDHRILSVAFELSFEVVDAEDGDPREGHAEASGTCAYSTEDNSISETALDRISVIWTNPDGTPGRGGNQYLRLGAAYLGGEPPAPLRIRSPLP